MGSRKSSDSPARRSSGQDRVRSPQTHTHRHPAQPSSGRSANSRQRLKDAEGQEGFRGGFTEQAGPSASEQQQNRYCRSPAASSQAPLPPAPSDNSLPGPPARLPAGFPLPGPPPGPPAATRTPQLPLPPPPPPPGALDFFSEHFDALRALYTKGLQPPIPKVKVLDNVVKCRLILPPELPDSWSAWNAAHPKIEPSEESARHKELAKHRTAAVMKREQDKAAKGNTLDKITEKFKEGPLLLLRRYYSTSVRLQVVTRHASGVRGTAVGYLHGFDKFMNLVLMNVDETYTVMVRVPHPYIVTVDEPADPQPLEPLYAINPDTGQQEQQLVMIQKQVNKFRWKRKAEQRKRRLLQVFLRGDNIVTITPVLRDVEKMWPTLINTWRAAGISEAALPTPAALVAAQSKLPPPPEPPSRKLGDTPAWTNTRR